MTRSIEVRDPADGSLVGTVPVASESEVAAAVEAARKAAPEWARTDPAARGAAAARRRYRDRGGGR